MIIPQTEFRAVYEGKEIHRETLPPGRYEIGRDATAHMRLLESGRVSRRHAVLTLNYFDWLIEDLGSSNGTYVGGRKISEPTLFFPNQDVRVGDVDLHLRRIGTDNLEGSIAPQAQAAIQYLPREVRGASKYRINGLIAMGGMGMVLEAQDIAMRRQVAIKTMLSMDSPEDVARFVEEAQITAQLEHPNIVPVYELNVNELEKPYFVMKLVHGESLHQVIQGLRMERPAFVERYPLGELLSIFLKACDAIAFAHSKGVVHRDLKPENLMLGDFGEVLVMDWGLAKPLGYDANAQQTASAARPMVSSLRSSDPDAINTMPGAAVGTVQFMSPEQASGNSREVDGRTDIYALGAILYSILTLRPPIEEGEKEEMLTRVVNGQITPPSRAIEGQSTPHLVNGQIPPGFLSIALKAMALAPEDRYQTVRAFQSALLACLNEEGRGRRLAGRFFARFGG